MPMKVVDHVKPIKDGGSPTDWDNLQSLCQTCHNQKTKRDTKKPKFINELEFSDKVVYGKRR